MNNDLDKLVKSRAEEWLAGNYDATTKQAVRDMIDNDPKELTECFYQSLEFGTGGLRGIMGVGTNRMNIYTTGMATQGFANYLKKSFAGQQISVAVAHDSRNNSPLFAQTVADIFSANGMKVYLFDALRPTPELSFAIRQLGCQSGVMITASHNPKEYNGYKAYWDDGAQVTSPHDTNIIDEVNKIKSVDEVKFAGVKENITIIGAEIDKIYLDALRTLTLSPESVKKHADMKIVYTPIHGTGVKLVPEILKMSGFKNIIHVDEQDIVDGNFPTVPSPNPEEPAALKMAIEKAIATDADLVMATDPDGDRVGIAIRNDKGEFMLVNGNQTAAILTYYICRRWKELGRLDGNQFIVKTIVTTELLLRIADSYGLGSFDVLTGFKYIAMAIRENEGKKTFVCGGEESYGFLVGDFVRDKDAVVSCMMIAEAAAWAKDQGMTLYDLLKEIAVEYGFFKEGLLSITRKGKSGQEEIKQMMVDLRANPPKELCGAKIVEVRDYAAGVRDLPKSDVLQFLTEDSTIISVRPSGTEPKIKFYFGVRGELCCKSKYDEVDESMTKKITAIKRELNLL